MTKALHIEGLSKQYKIQGQEQFWALKNLDLTLKKGEVLGLIGANGAGKSTLLKILSRITAPTEGGIKAYGRVASLLEVGTGFHPELSGRDNIFLNGSILGMKRAEIKDRFDEIVSFAGVERFLDMPVKRYSSGMYVRLAFSVAAHLDADILLIDEVLAVGDGDFQQKCLQRMEDLSKSQSRSIIFVSHNMQAIQSLCDRVAWISEGELKEIGEAQSVIANYRSSLSELHKDLLPAARKDREGDGRAQLLSLECSASNTSIMSGEEMQVHLQCQIHDQSAKRLKINLHLFNESGHFLSTLEKDLELEAAKEISLKCLLPEIPMMGGKFFWNSHLYLDGIRADFLGRAAYFEVNEAEFKHHEIAQNRKSPGFHLKQYWS